MFTSGNGQSSRRLKLSVEARIVVRFHGLVEEPCATRNAHKFDRPLPTQHGFDRSSDSFRQLDGSNRSDALTEIRENLERALAACDQSTAGVKRLMTINSCAGDRKGDPPGG
jgi:hypothetical protein